MARRTRDRAPSTPRRYLARAVNFSLVSAWLNVAETG